MSTSALAARRPEATMEGPIEPLSDDAFVAAFEACTLSADAFTHAEHVRLAWLYLRQLPLPEAIARFSAALRRFAAHHGAAGKYHETITWAYILLIAERMAGEASFDAFRAVNPDLFTRPSVLLRYYRPETLTSDRARHHFLLPDLGVG